jgi:hypothetical protein
MVSALFNCLAELKTPLLMITMFTVVFALFGLHLFMGKLLNKCVCAPDPLLNLTADNWTEWVADADHWITEVSGETKLCGNTTSSQQCHGDGQSCAALGYAKAVPTCLAVGPNPNSGYSNFDNMGSASLTVFQLVTAGDSPSRLLRPIRSALGRSMFGAGRSMLGFDAWRWAVDVQCWRSMFGDWRSMMGVRCSWVPSHASNAHVLTKA